MTTRVIQNVEQHNRDMFKLHQDNANTPPVGTREFRNPFMQQSVNALLSAILAKGTGVGESSVPVSSMSQGDITTAETAEASGVFRPPNKKGVIVKRPEGEAKGERVGKDSGNVQDTEQKELSKAAQDAQKSSAADAPKVEKAKANLTKLQDDAVKSNVELTAQSMKKQAPLKEEIAAYTRDAGIIQKVIGSNKKALQDLQSKMGKGKMSKMTALQRKRLTDKKSAVEAEMKENNKNLRRIIDVEKASAEKRLALEKASLAGKLLQTGKGTAKKQKAALKKIKARKSTSDASKAAALTALQKAKGLTKKKTDDVKAADSKKVAAKQKKDAKEADEALKKALAKAKKGTEESKQEETEEDAAKTKAKLAKAKKRASGSGSDSNRRRSKTPSTFAKPTSATQREADKHKATKVKEKERQVFHKKAEKEADKHKKKTDAHTAKEIAKSTTTAARKAALQKAQLATLTSYMKISALDAANPNVSNGNYMFRVNAQTASRDEIRKERKDWSAWYTARQKLFSAYEKDKAKQNALLAKQPSTRDGGVRGAGTRAGAVQTGGGN